MKKDFGINPTQSTCGGKSPFVKGRATLKNPVLNRYSVAEQDRILNREKPYPLTPSPERRRGSIYNLIPEGSAPLWTPRFYTMLWCQSTPKIKQSEVSSYASFS
jgi:hypothetical protein